jgi:hypothetical protein
MIYCLYHHWDADMVEVRFMVKLADRPPQLVTRARMKPAEFEKFRAAEPRCKFMEFEIVV